MDGGEYGFVAVRSFPNQGISVSIDECVARNAEFINPRSSFGAIGDRQSFHGPKRPRYSTEFMKPLIMLR
jgi:hypothetical protein